jgi:hypothetical protein
VRHRAYIVDDDRLPVAGHATYRGDARGILEPVNNPTERVPGQPGVLAGVDTARGPNTLREHLFPVEAVFDDETGTTRVGFAYQPPHPDGEPMSEPVGAWG